MLLESIVVALVGVVFMLGYIIDKIRDKVIQHKAVLLEHINLIEALELSINAHDTRLQILEEGLAFQGKRILELGLRS